MYFTINYRTFVRMQYFININQQKSVEWELTLNEAFIFAWIYEGASWAQSKVEPDGSIFYFLSRKKCADDLPAVTEKTDTIYRLFKSLQEKGLIQFDCSSSKDWIALTEKGRTWRMISDLGSKSEKVGSPSEQLGSASEISSDFHPTYSNIYYNNNILDTIEGEVEKKDWNPDMKGSTRFENALANQNFPVEYETLLRLVLKHTGKETTPNDKKAIASLKTLLKSYTMEDVEHVVIEISKMDFAKERKYDFVTPEYILRPRVFDNNLSNWEMKQQRKTAPEKSVADWLKSLDEKEAQENQGVK